MNFPKTIILIAIIFPIPNKFECLIIFPKKEIINCGQVREKSTIIDGLLAKGFVVTLKFPEK
jgi:hypothetical protein